MKRDLMMCKRMKIQRVLLPVTHLVMLTISKTVMIYNRITIHCYIRITLYLGPIFQIHLIVHLRNKEEDGQQAIHYKKR